MAASDSAGKGPERPAALPSGSGGTILLVDDDAAVRKLGEKMLQRVGHPCITAVDGEDAVAVFQGRKDDIHAIILDLTMPRMDGIRAAEALRELHPEVPILLSSGYSEAEVGSRLGGVGISGFIQKPYRLDRLRAALKTVLPDR
jgi:CheY-like chemotaxis protein